MNTFKVMAFILTYVIGKFFLGGPLMYENEKLVGKFLARLLLFFVVKALKNVKNH